MYFQNQLLCILTNIVKMQNIIPKNYLEFHILLQIDPLDFGYRCHTGEELLICPYCSKKFKEKHKMKRHILVHTGEKPFKCSLCDYSCNRKDNLSKHVQLKHSNYCN